MKIKLKPLSKQVMVITGATSGIGLATARRAAKEKIKLVLGARNTEALQKIQSDLSSRTEVEIVTVDVGNEQEVRQLAEIALKKFGRIDTWVNNAGLSIYGRIEQSDLADERRLFDTNYWGVVHGCRIALEHLKEHGGAIINVGSILSDQAIPLQSAYTASKHAVKGFTDSLRMEIAHAHLPISVTLIKPSGINTPFTQHAKNNMDHEPSLPPPVYSAELVADAILYAAQNSIRDFTVGGGGRVMTFFGQCCPSWMDSIMSLTMFKGQKKDSLSDTSKPHSLYEAQHDGNVRGDYTGFVHPVSLYHTIRKYPKTSLAVAGAAYLLWRHFSSSKTSVPNLKFLSHKPSWMHSLKHPSSWHLSSHHPSSWNSSSWMPSSWNPFTRSRLKEWRKSLPGDKYWQR
jgi:short-subunit dehydrogenase